MKDYGPYPIAIAPGQTRQIQILNNDQTPYAIPAGATVQAIATDQLQSTIANLSPAIANAAQGLISLTLPDNQRVRQAVNLRAWYDVWLSVPGATKRLPVSSLEIAFSPTKWATAAPAALPAGGGTAGGGTTGGGATAPQVLYIQDQTWVNAAGKKVVVTVKTTAQGDFFQLTEVI